MNLRSAKQTGNNIDKNIIRIRKTDIREGSIFSVISDIIDESEASFAVMGTHGIKGMQKFTGSWALKVIAGSKAPFIVVQGPPLSNKGFENIVFPVDFKFSAKEKLVWAGFMSKFYKSKFHSFSAHFA